MKFLILGGTAFLGRHAVMAAREAGHQVTLFNRGKTAPDLFPELERLTGDREGDLSGLHDREWDAVIDTSGYFSEVVGASAKALRDRVGQYVFISTVSVYKTWEVHGQDESATVVEPMPSGAGLSRGEHYGEMKLACEETATQLIPNGALIVRPGLIVGPHDPTDRFTYWPSRIARGGEVLAPGSPERLTQFIDVRDLARWLVEAVERRLTRTHNACGPSLPMRELLDACRTVAGGNARLTWVGDDFLLRENVTPYTEIPLWIPGVDSSFDNRRAQAAGLKCRPQEETIRDTLAWDRARPPEQPRRGGLSEGREAALLMKWKRLQEGEPGGGS